MIAVHVFEVLEGS